MPEQLFDVKRIVSGLVLELSIELDGHYDDEDFFALEPSIQPIRDAVAWLTYENVPIPDAATHVLSRFHRSQN